MFEANPQRFDISKTLTLRDYFAVRIVSTLVARLDGGAAEKAYKVANEMIMEKAKYDNLEALKKYEEEENHEK